MQYVTPLTFLAANVAALLLTLFVTIGVARKLAAKPPASEMEHVRAAATTSHRWALVATAPLGFIAAIGFIYPLTIADHIFDIISLVVTAAIFFIVYVQSSSTRDFVR